MALTLLASAIHAVAPYVPPGLVLSVAACFIVGGKYTTFWRNEFIGTLLMVSFTFSAGKWVGVDSQNVAWLSHAIGVVAADYIGGGQHVNPAVSVSMWSLGKCDYTEMFVRMAGQMGGGLVAFPLFHLLSETLGWTPFGGPDFDKEADEEGVGAAFNELFATMLLLFLIYTVNWEINFGKYHYWIKQTLTALGIRYLIEMFPASGPAMNPMLGTTWAVFSADENVSAATDDVYFCRQFLR
jgi:glycerol uptake facilitator-like aquaporin